MCRAALIAFALAAYVTAGCAAPRYEAFPSRLAPPLPGEPEEARSLPMFAGSTGQPIDWSDLLDAAAWADIIIIGEQHDDGMGHAVQLAMAEDVLDRWPGSALSMEMLERDEQIIVDDYLEDIIDTAAFIRLTFSANWGGEGMWARWFQPIVDAAKDRGARVIAANAPRRYVRLARTHGYVRLRALPPKRRAMFEFPRSRNHSMYRERFDAVMSHAHGDDETDENAEVDAAQQRRLDAAFRSQLLWDATMAASIARARPSRRAKIVHLVGQFHSDFDGGLVQELRARLPAARLLTISMQRVWRDEMRDEDRRRADVIIYTGEREPARDDEEDDASPLEAANGHAAIIARHVRDGCARHPTAGRRRPAVQ